MELEHRDDGIVVRGERGELAIAREDEVAWKLLMLVEGECGPDTRIDVAERFGFSKQRYYQVRTAFGEQGAAGLASGQRGPKRNYRRGGEVSRQIIRYRFLNPDVSAEVIGQKLRQDGFQISDRSVYRVFEDFGLQKKGSINAGRSSPKTPSR